MNNTIFNRQPECKSIKLGVILLGECYDQARNIFGGLTVQPVFVYIIVSRGAGVGEGMFVLYEYFLTAGNKASAKGVSLWEFHGTNCSPKKCWNLET